MMINHQKIADVTIIGAGIVGMSCAVQLQQQGLSVMVVDQEAPGDSTSHGNAGVIARCGCIPVAMPGFAWQVPGLLLDPAGPLSMPLGNILNIAPWGLKFIRNSSKNRILEISSSLNILLQDALSLHLKQAKLVQAQHLVKASNYHYLYRSAAAFEKEKLSWQLRREYGIKYNIIKGSELRNLEPDVSAEFNFVVSLQDHGFTSNPGGLVKAIAEHFQKSGGIILQRKILGFVKNDDTVHALQTEQGDVLINKLVIAGGAWSTKLASELQDNVPLTSERGYHIEVPTPKVELHSPIMFSEGKLVATPMQGGIRFAGLVELQKPDAEADTKFGRRLLHHAKQLFPTIDTSDFVEWMGSRPSITDSLPVIGKSVRYDKVFYAFGHQHMGLTLAPQTGKLVTELVLGKPSSIDLSPYRVNRF